MRTDTAKPVRLKDYRVPDYLIGKADLDVKLTSICFTTDSIPGQQG